MTWFAPLVFVVALGVCANPVPAQQLVHFPSADDNGPGAPATTLDGYLYRAPGDGPHAALVGLHGCSGMFRPTTGQVSSNYRAWATELGRYGWDLLMVDSLRPRNHGEMCSITGFDPEIYRKRSNDAYGALRYLQTQPSVRADRIAVIGWSQGGGVALTVIDAASAAGSSADFRAAVAFYPGRCAPGRRSASWTTAVPLLVLLGEADVWTPAAPCETFLDGAAARGSAIASVIYPGAYHAFDSPSQRLIERPEYRTRAGVVPVLGTDPAARQDALQRVPAFLAPFLGT
ncbi:MAG: dienelactone hydrolase family protein [Alphaproteobacteria bacterium]|nr:dienelactone hydrolase family protein [Alphaproteobacteria bacterium]